MTVTEVLHWVMLLQTGQNSSHSTPPQQLHCWWSCGWSCELYNECCKCWLTIFSFLLDSAAGNCSCTIVPLRKCHVNEWWIFLIMWWCRMVVKAERVNKEESQSEGGIPQHPQCPFSFKGELIGSTNCGWTIYVNVTMLSTSFSLRWVQLAGSDLRSSVGRGFLRTSTTVNVLVSTEAAF